MRRSRNFAQHWSARVSLILLCSIYLGCTTPATNIPDDSGVRRLPNGDDWCSFGRLLDHALRWGEYHPDEDGISDAVEWLSGHAFRAGAMVRPGEVDCARRS